MRKSKQLLNLPVFSLEEGQQIGRTKGLVVDPSCRAVVALAVEEKRWPREQKYIPFQNIHSIGEDAVTVKQGNFLQKKSALPEINKLTRDRVNIIGTRLVAENGAILGRVSEFSFDQQTGEITGLEFSPDTFCNVLFAGRSYLDAGFVRTLGKQVTICASDCLGHITLQESGLKDTLGTIKNFADKVWTGTLNKSRAFRAGHSFPFRRKKDDQP